MRDAGFKIPDTGYKIPDTRYRIQNAGSIHILYPGSGIPYRFLQFNDLVLRPQFFKRFFQPFPVRIGNEHLADVFGANPMQ